MSLSPRFIRFGIVGAGNTLLDAGLFALLHAAGLSVLLANGISSSAGICLSLALNTRYTFGRHKLTGRQVLLFVAINLTGLWLLQPAVIWLLLFGVRPVCSWLWAAATAHTQQLISNFAASLLATGSTFIWNYMLYRNYVYTTKDQPD